MKKQISFLSLALLAALLLAACGGAGGAGAPVSKISVEMTEFTFSPNKLAVFAGQEITLELSNKGAIRHDFTILKKDAVAKIPFDPEKQKDDILFEFPVDPQQSGTYKFTLPEAGEYTIVCIVQGHLESGMTAKMSAVAP
jgi:uncharacterized cupredoxin-like copper-binding protein